jgi:tetratricopeptide (TPR) repeat protein
MIVAVSAGPVRPQDLECITSLYGAMVGDDGRRGRVLIVSGAPGSGRTLLLRAATVALRKFKPAPLVVSGRVASQEDGRAGFVTWDDPPSGLPVKESLAFIQGGLGLGGMVVPVLRLIAAILGVSRAAHDLVERLRAEGKTPDRVRLVTDLLRAAASERPCVCLIDDADKGAGSFWRDLEFSFAAEITRELPLLLVLAVQDSEGMAGGRDEADAQRMARELRERGFARPLRLEPFSGDDVREWIGPADSEVVDELLNVTWGQASLMGSVWKEWTRTESVARPAGDARWEFTPAADEAGLGSVSTALRVQLERVVTELDRDTRILRCGALEGRTFTAECVAQALGLATDEVNNALNAVVARQELEAGAIVENYESVDVLRVGGRDVLHLYRFVSPWHWLALRAALSEEEQTELAARLAVALSRQYEHDLWRVARSLAELSRKAGLAADAAHFQRMADFGGPDDELRARAEYLLDVDGSEWDAWESERAGRVLLEAAMTLDRIESFAKLRAYADRAQVFAARAGNGPLRVDAYVRQGYLETDLREFGHAREHLETARRVAADVPYREGEAWASAELGRLELVAFAYAATSGHEPDPRSAMEAVEAASRAALVRFQNLGDLGGQARAHMQIGRAALVVTDLETALVEFERALDLHRRQGDDYLTAFALLSAARVSMWMGLQLKATSEYAWETYRESAVAYYAEARTIKQATVSQWNLNDLHELASVARDVGDHDGVGDVLDEMRRLAIAHQDPESLRLVQEAIALYGGGAAAHPAAKPNQITDAKPSSVASSSTTTTSFSWTWKR